MSLLAYKSISLIYSSGGTATTVWLLKFIQLPNNCSLTEY